MLAYVTRKLLYNVPVFLGIIAVLMLALRVNDPVWGKLGKHASQEKHDEEERRLGLDDPFHVQYFRFLWGFGLSAECWDKPGRTVGAELGDAIGPSLAITVPALILTTILSLGIGILSAYRRGRMLDRSLMGLAVVGMSISFLVYIIFGQYFGAYKLNQWRDKPLFAIQGYDATQPLWWITYCLLPVLIGTIVALGYDSRFYRALAVEEINRDYIRTARSKGLSERSVLFKHLLKNAMLTVITHVMITLPFLVEGSLLLEVFFNIPGMGKTLITAINAKDFPVIQGFTAIFAALFIASNILTDVLYALVDPRVRLS